MPRRQFQTDLHKATESISIAGISDVRPGGDDGEFTFMCMADGQKVQISVLVPGRFKQCLIAPTSDLPLCLLATLSPAALIFILPPARLQPHDFSKLVFTSAPPSPRASR